MGSQVRKFKRIEGGCREYIAQAPDARIKGASGSRPGSLRHAGSGTYTYISYHNVDGPLQLHIYMVGFTPWVRKPPCPEHSNSWLTYSGARLLRYAEVSDLPLTRRVSHF